LIIDTDVLIWYSRARPKAIELIHNLKSFSISAVTYMEIVQGVRNKTELNAFKKSLAILNVDVIPINELISTQAMSFVEEYALSHSMQLADALIGATAIIQQKTLITANDKHYHYLPDIKMQKFVID
jgi:predicted nucleic acid-binding protein